MARKYENDVPTATRLEDGRNGQPHGQTEDGLVSKSFLLDLPQELLEGVVEHLEVLDVSSLRLGCRELNTKLSGPFLKKLFDGHCFILSDRASMRILAEVSCYGAFAKSIRCLRLSADVLAETRNLPFKPKKTIDGSRWNKNAKRMLRKLKVDEAKFLQDELASVLEDIFENFKKAGALVDISFVDAGSGDFAKCRAAGLKRIRDLFQLDRGDFMMKCSVSHGYLGDPSVKLQYHKAVYQALGKSQFAPQGLQLGASGYDGRTSQLYRRGNEVSSYAPHMMDRLPISWFASHAAQIFVTNLRTLSLSIEVHSPYGPVDVDVKAPERLQWIRDLMRFVDRARNVEHLKLCLGPQTGDLGPASAHADLFRDVFYNIARGSSMNGYSQGLLSEGKSLPKIKSLELGYHLIDFNLLLDFVRQRKETLKKIVLTRITDHGSEETGGPRAIRQAADADSDDTFFVGWHNCYVRRY